MTPARFRKKIVDFYKKHGRSFPWRINPSSRGDTPFRKGRITPYHILVSEIMLQQTQTFRVVPKYEAFIKEFPTVQALAAAPLAKVLRLWSGLGYNRRALYLHRAAQATMTRHSGTLPRTSEELRALPGVGPYTAAAVLVFAYNKPYVMIETNIRAALIHEFFPRKNKVTDKKLLPLLAAAMPETSPREFYYALMDYGAFLKQKHPNPSRRSAHHAKQSRFEGSDRQIRGQIIRLLITEGAASEPKLLARADSEATRAQRILRGLIQEGFVVRRGKILQIKS